MAIKKEWHCNGCNIDFESALNLCKRCGAEARRVFLTAPQISVRGSSKFTDRLLERNFRKRGISNFTNTSGGNKISWDSGFQGNLPDVSGPPGRAFPQNDWRSGGWGKEYLSGVNNTMGTNFSTPALSGPKVSETNVTPDNPAQASTGWQKFVQTEVINKDK